MPLRTVARCNLNKWQTPLFSFDEKGVYVYCKDCRRENGRRGEYHLVSWGDLFALMLDATKQSLPKFFRIGVEEHGNGKGREISSGDLILTPISVHNSEPAEQQSGDRGEELDGAGLPVSSSTRPDPADEPAAD